MRRATSSNSLTPARISYFYPRSPCGERLSLAYKYSKPYIFLSTLSLRRATLRVVDGSKSSIISIHALLAESDCYSLRHSAQGWHFYPRSPCGERPWARGSRITYVEFLSTLSLRRATCYSLRHSAQGWHFYPRSPCGERRAHYDNYNLHCVISIHALLAESDS